MISNPKGSSNVKLGVTLEICTESQKARTIKTAETLVRPCAIKMNCKGHALHYEVLHIPQLLHEHVHPSAVLM